MNPAEKVHLNDWVEASEGGILSKKVMAGKCGNVTMFALAANEAISEHSAPYDALVVIHEGEAIVTIDGRDHTLVAGDAIILPAHVPHALRAPRAFKMMLVMIKSEKAAG
ncbi:MAG: cupin domain-containing protein [Calditrichaeota bacterium]|nr:MAG: cupin domain-containing protein [Calditrichota bacterium]